MSRLLPPKQVLDRYTTMGDLTGNVRRILKRGLPVIGTILSVATAYLLLSGRPGATSFGLMSAGVIVALLVWANDAIGVPLLPMIAVQQFLVCALPILTQHEVLTFFSPDLIVHAGVEVLVFQVCLIVSWRLGMQVFSPSPPLSYALVGIDREGLPGLAKLGFGLVVSSTVFLVLESLGLTYVLFQFLPNGVTPMVNATLGATSACGFFLLSMIVGAGGLAATSRTVFWALMAANCLISASSLLLSSATVVISSVIIGLFWGTGRIPWRLTLLMMAAISFFNTGKYTMRERYWHQGEDEPPPTYGLVEMPAFYVEWAQSSIDSFTSIENGPPDMATKARRGSHGDQGLFERLNNLQNILFVVDAMEHGVAPLNGETYAIIPPLLIPRIFWPNKPRTHEGQILLNVHFGRQLLESTFTTYVAWGLLAEAYGNFGAIKGVVFLGFFMGFCFAWAENFTARKPLLSTEGFVAFAIFLGLANSFEMVASVMITTIFQSLVPIIAACAPFVRQKTIVRPTE